MSVGLLIIHLVIGLTFVGHGAQKLFGWFGGHGLKGTAGWLESIGVKPGVLMAFLAGAGELVGGLLFAAGFLTPVGALLIVVTMLVAIFTVHGKNGYWATESGFEYNAILIAVAIGVALIGPGSYALDAIVFG
ncbi:DoxX family protein [Aneurinibacillus aneurinilyticus]|jgi:putative oxidoreductase|uniref:DoxX family protein n=1 Tax=Aneurinibacillus aneurinilyticus ATCC 12856 TaxID=649747 RepID=U1Y9H1_ANEAE|nr:DoxX family protein [Aneurinibacillus aneurinilyticus]ERI07476.1 DoxX family protein [Aneurinibacillus aneurinilyticus ATCC 12856]MCI1692838.1 DoxX family protein [Aneurinibacillus aneurinilyticus]MED0709209.1 DoxX family protein [Aneurinibacillus aneurinilyticus]MED0721999.1 DoxX family protein [Aneurinibacillus aneurinilyticus]MED0732630.1 DoxX family protein [Aneurinibacillus aneurinilyticus]